MVLSEVVYPIFQNCLSLNKESNTERSIVRVATTIIVVAFVMRRNKLSTWGVGHSQGRSGTHSLLIYLTTASVDHRQMFFFSLTPSFLKFFVWIFCHIFLLRMNTVTSRQGHYPDRFAF